MYHVWYVFDTIKKLAKSSKIHNIGHGTMASCNHALFCFVSSTKYKCSKLFFYSFLQQVYQFASRHHCFRECLQFPPGFLHSSAYCCCTSTAAAISSTAAMLNWNVVKVENFYHDYSCFAPSCTFMFLNLRQGQYLTQKFN